MSFFTGWSQQDSGYDGYTGEQRHFKESGLTTDELMDATANDMVVVADVNNEAVLDAVMDKVEEFLKKQSTAAEGKKGSESVKSWDDGTEENVQCKPGSYHLFRSICSIRG